MDVMPDKPIHGQTVLGGEAHGGVDGLAVMEGLEFLGLKIDPEKNNVRGKEAIISTDDSPNKILLIQVYRPGIPGDRGESLLQV